MTMITPSYLGETIEYSSLHACRSTLEDPTMHLQMAVIRHPNRNQGKMKPRSSNTQRRSSFWRELPD